MTGKVFSTIGGLKQIRHLINKETSLTIHNSLILHLFDYCDTVWGTVDSSLATMLQELNNRAGRVISELGYEIRSSEIRNQLGWSTLQERRTKHISTLMYKLLHSEAPYLKRLFHYVNESSNYDLRDSNINLILPKPNSDYLKESLSFTGSKVWNNLHLNTKISTF